MDDEVEESGAEPLEAAAHGLERGHVEALVRVDGRGVNADARFVRQVRLETVVEGLLDQGVAVGHEEDLLRPVCAEKEVRQPHRRAGLAGACRHDQERAAPARGERLRDAADGFMLVGPIHDRAVDGLRRQPAFSNWRSMS
jgi:hypothetical protein